MYIFEIIGGNVHTKINYAYFSIPFKFKNKFQFKFSGQKKKSNKHSLNFYSIIKFIYRIWFLCVILTQMFIVLCVFFIELSIV